jgi:hypothetical protein
MMICRCRHCHRPKVNRPRGLCWSCYYSPGVKDKYPSESKFHCTKEANAQDEAENDFTGEPPLDEPTEALPGTEEKIKVMARRAALRLALFHPQDATR